MVRSKDAPPTGQPRELECRLVCLRSGVAEKYARLTFAHPLDQFCPGVQHGLGGKKIGGMHKGAALLGNSICYLRIAIAQGSNGDAGQQVNVVLPVFISKGGVLPGHQAEWWLAIGIGQRF